MKESYNIFTKPEFTKQRRKELAEEYTEEERAALCSPLKAIRKKCIECCGFSPDEAAKCTCYTCALWDFRFGSNPYKQGRVLTEEEKEAVRERLAKAREARIALDETEDDDEDE